MKQMSTKLSCLSIIANFCHRQYFQYIHSRDSCNTPTYEVDELRHVCWGSRSNLHQGYAGSLVWFAPAFSKARSTHALLNSTHMLRREQLTLPADRSAMLWQMSIPVAMLHLAVRLLCGLALTMLCTIRSQGASQQSATKQ